MSARLLFRTVSLRTRGRSPRPGLRACLQRAFGVGHGFEPEKCAAPARSWATHPPETFLQPCREGRAVAFLGASLRSRSRPFARSRHKADYVPSCLGGETW